MILEYNQDKHIHVHVVSLLFYRRN